MLWTNGNVGQRWNNFRVLIAPTLFLRLLTWDILYSGMESFMDYKFILRRLNSGKRAENFLNWGPSWLYVENSVSTEIRTTVLEIIINSYYFKKYLFFICLKTIEYKILFVIEGPRSITTSARGTVREWRNEWTDRARLNENFNPFLKTKLAISQKLFIRFAPNFETYRSLLQRRLQDKENYYFFGLGSFPETSIFVSFAYNLQISRIIFHFKLCHVYNSM